MKMHLSKKGVSRVLACTIVAATLAASSSCDVDAAAARVRRDVAAESLAKIAAEGGVPGQVSLFQGIPQSAPQPAIPNSVIPQMVTPSAPVITDVPAVPETAITAQPAVETPPVTGTAPVIPTADITLPQAAPDDEDTPETGVVVDGDSSQGTVNASTNRNLQATQAALPAGSYVIKGTCTTGFSTSSSNRKTNIAVASSKIDKLILAPGQEISVSTVFTPRTAANGYKSAGVYSGGKTVSGIGGGICQVSTTIYNAAMNAGLTITERHPHSMPVSYIPLGMDAAISAGSKDLRIRNDYSFPVMFEAYTYGDNLTVNVYTDEAYTAGTTYRLNSVKKGSLKADTYLEISNNGIVVENRYVGSSSYMAHK